MDHRLIGLLAAALVLGSVLYVWFLAAGAAFDRGQAEIPVQGQASVPALGEPGSARTRASEASRPKRAQAFRKPTELPRTLRGRVQDNDAATGLPGAVVYLLPATFGVGFNPDTHLARLSDVPENRVVSEAITSGEGEFALSIPTEWATRRLHLVAILPGYLRSGLPDLIPDQVQEELVVQMTRGWALQGTVTDTSNIPVGGIRVLATTDYSARGRELRMVRQVRSQRRARPRLNDAFCFSETRTNTDGSFLIRGLFRGEYVLNIDADEWVMLPHATVSAGEPWVNLKVSRAFRLTIEARDAESKKPIEKFLVRVTVRVSRGDLPLVLTGLNGSLSAAFQLESDSPAVNGNLIVRAAGYVPEAKSVNLRRDAAVHLSLRLERAEPVAVPISVTDSQGKTVRSFRVAVSSPKGGRFREVRVEELRTSQAVAYLPPGRWIVRVMHPLQFPGGASWKQLVSVDAQRGQDGLSAQLDTTSQIEVDLRGIRDQERVKSITFRSRLGIIEAERPPNSEDGVLRWVGVPAAQWTLQVQTADGPLVLSVPVTGGLAKVRF